jgi:hypothetical protein
MNLRKFKIRIIHIYVVILMALTIWKINPLKKLTKFHFQADLPVFCLHILKKQDCL